MVKTTDGSSYTGLTSATINGNRYLYAANFNKGTVDVYDNAFNKVNLQPTGMEIAIGTGTKMTSPLATIVFPELRALQCPGHR